RRRIWIASRHLHNASKLADAELSGLAKKYLAQLDTPEAELKDLPEIALSTSGGGSDKSAPPEAEKTAPKSAEKKTDKAGVVTLAPLEVEKKKEEAPEPSSRREERPETPKAPVQSNPNARAPDPEAKVIESIANREIPIPLSPRALTLDDPNISNAL